MVKQQIGTGRQSSSAVVRLVVHGVVAAAVAIATITAILYDCAKLGSIGIKPFDQVFRKERKKMLLLIEVNLISVNISGDTVYSWTSLQHHPW